MRETLVTFFADHASWIVWTHVTGAALWVGTYVAVWLILQALLSSGLEPVMQVRLTQTVLGRMLKLLLPIVIIVAATAMVMAVGLGFKNGAPDLYRIVHVKEALWTVMAIVYGVMALMLKSSRKAMVVGAETKAVKKLGIVFAYLIPLSVFIGLGSMFAGVVLRGY